MSVQFTIGDLAYHTGVSAKTIRYYEQIGLLRAPERTEAGYRLYSTEDIARLEFIRRAKLLGFPLRQIKEILAYRERGELPCPYVMHQIETKIADVDRTIAQLVQLRADLEALHERAATIRLDDLPSDECICQLIETEAPI